MDASLTNALPGWLKNAVSSEWRNLSLVVMKQPSPSDHRTCQKASVPIYYYDMAKWKYCCLGECDTDSELVGEWVLWWLGELMSDWVRLSNEQIGRLFSEWIVGWMVEWVREGVRLKIHQHKYFSVWLPPCSCPLEVKEDTLDQFQKPQSLPMYESSLTYNL